MPNRAPNWGGIDRNSKQIYTYLLRPRLGFEALSPPVAYGGARHVRIAAVSDSRTGAAFAEAASTRALSSISPPSAVTSGWKAPTVRAGRRDGPIPIIGQPCAPTVVWQFFLISSRQWATDLSDRKQAAICSCRSADSVLLVRRVPTNQQRSVPGRWTYEPT